LLGEHNEEILKSLLDYSDADIAALYRDEVLVRDRLLDDLERTRGAQPEVGAR
jgi:hypothetical protein